MTVKLTHHKGKPPQSLASSTLLELALLLIMMRTMIVQRDKKPPKLTGTRGNKKDQTLNSLDVSWGGKIHADDKGRHSTTKPVRHRKRYRYKCLWTP